MLLDDCEGVSNWTITGTDAAVAGTMDAAAAFMGTKGFLLFSGDTDAAADDYALAVQNIQRPTSGLLVYRAKCRVPSMAAIYSIAFGVREYDGSRQYGGGIEYVPGTPACSYTDATGSGVAMADLAFALDDGVWFDLELVLDCLKHEYVSFQLAHVKVDLSGVGYQDVGASASLKCQLRLYEQIAGAAAASVHWDAIYAGEFLEV